jgi:hypothetical protein
MALDSPPAVSHLAVLDVVPTGEAYARADADFSRERGPGRPAGRMGHARRPRHQEAPAPAGPAHEQPGQISTTRLGDWYATLLNRFPGHLAQALAAQDVPQAFIAEELSHMQDVPASQDRKPQSGRHHERVQLPRPGHPRPHRMST